MRNGRNDPKIASLEEARRRSRQGKPPGGGAPRGPGGGLRELLIGAVIVVMALGMLAAWIAPIVGVTLPSIGAR